MTKPNGRELFGGLPLVAGGLSAAAQEIPKRALGSTGVLVSIIGVGGYHIGTPKDDELGIRIIRTALDSGVNFLDNCLDYHGGGSEVRMGKALRDGYRNKAFLMAKLDGHTKAAAPRQLDESLQRMQHEHI